MMRILSSCAVLVLSLLFISCADSDDDATLAPTETGSASPTPSMTASESPSPETYRNERYGYEITVPPLWRVGHDWMEAFAEVTSYSRYTASADDRVVITSLDENGEAKFIEQARKPQVSLTGLEPWLEIRFLGAIEILPVGADLDTYLANVVEGGVTRQNSDVREIELDSGQAATRFLRREVDDRGDYTFDVVYVPIASDSCPPDQGRVCTGIVLRNTVDGYTSLRTPSPLVTAPEVTEVFEAIFGSFRLVSD